jgi:hypothetical protein
MTLSGIANGGHAAINTLLSNWHAVPVEFVILVVTAFTRAKIGKIVHELDGRDPLDHFEADLVLAAQPQRRPMQHTDRGSVHLISYDRQFVAHLRQAVRVVVAPTLATIGE